MKERERDVRVCVMGKRRKGRERNIKANVTKEEIARDSEPLYQCMSKTNSGCAMGFPLVCSVDNSTPSLCYCLYVYI